MEKEKFRMNNSSKCAQVENNIETFPTVSIPVDHPMQTEYVAILAQNLAEIAKNNRVNIMLGCVQPIPAAAPTDKTGYDYADLIQKMAENAIKNSIPWPPLENLKQQTETEDDAVEEEDNADNEDCNDCESRNICVCNTCDCRTCPLTRNPEKCHVKHWSCEECDGQDPIGVEHELECPLIKEYLPVMRRFQQLLEKLRNDYHSNTNDKKGYKVISSVGGTDGRLAVTVMFDDLRKAAFSLELHFDRMGNVWEYRVPRSKKLRNPYSDGAEYQFIRALIQFGEQVTGKSYVEFLKKYDCVHEDLTGLK